jgi:hypothetical protein
MSQGVPETPAEYLSLESCLPELVRRCPDVSSYKGLHLLVKVYHRPWYRLFRKTLVICCWKCDLRVPAP